MHGFQLSLHQKKVMFSFYFLLLDVSSIIVCPDTDAEPILFYGTYCCESRLLAWAGPSLLESWSWHGMTVNSCAGCGMIVVPGICSLTPIFPTSGILCCAMFHYYCISVILLHDIYQNCVFMSSYNLQNVLMIRGMRA